MLNLLLGTRVLPEGPVRWTLEIDGPEMRAKYKHNETILAEGRMLHNEEDEVYDEEMGDLERTHISLEILGPGRCNVGLDCGNVDCTLERNFRFYMKVKYRWNRNMYTKIVDGKVIQIPKP